MLYNLSGTNGLLAEARLIQKSLPLVQYDLEPYPIRSEAQPSMRNLFLAIAAMGITIYQDKSISEIFRWTEIWNAGYEGRKFWLRIFRDGESSRQKYILPNKRLCKVVWKSFRLYFKFYIRDHSIPPKVAWGRVAPTVNRIDFLQDIIQSNQARPYSNQSSPPQPNEQTLLMPTTELWWWIEKGELCKIPIIIYRIGNIEFNDNICRMIEKLKWQSDINVKRGYALYKTILKNCWKLISSETNSLTAYHMNAYSVRIIVLS